MIRQRYSMSENEYFVHFGLLITPFEINEKNQTSS